jgi:hypothetical protein
MVVVALLLALGALLLLIHAHFASRSAWDRPAWARGAGRLAVLRAAGWVLVASGVGVLAVRSLLAGVAAAAILLGLWGWTRWVRSAAHLARALSREVERLRSRSPERSEHELLCSVVLARHPRWGEDLAGRIVAEQGDARRVAEMLIRMERARTAGLPGIRRRAKGRGRVGESGSGQ